MPSSRARWFAAALGLVLILGALVAWRLRQGSEASLVAPSATASAPPVKRPRPPDIRKEAKAALSGFVTAPDKTPVARATVCATASSPRLSKADTAEPTCVLTDATGHYRIADLVPARYEVAASAERHRPAHFRTPPPALVGFLDLEPGGSGVADLTLIPGGVLVRGRVTDLSGGVIRNARVALFSGRSRDDFALARSDAAGAFSGWVAEGRVWARANADGYAEGSKEAAAPGPDLEILLTPESVLVGRVVELGTDDPVPGARISLDNEWSSGRLGEAQTLSDEAGRFQIHRLSPGRYKPSATAPGRYGRARESTLLGLGETSKEIVIEVHPAFDVTGRVTVAPAAAACPDGGVQLQDRVRKDRRDAPLAKDGVARFEGLLPGSYDVQVWCEGRVPEDKYPPVVVAAADVTGLAWSVREGLSLRGHVVDGDDKPVEARVRAAPKGGDPRAQRVNGSASTEADGSFAITGLLPGTYAVSANVKDHPNPAPTEVELRAGRAADLKIVVQIGGDIDGSVADSEGHPVAGAEVSAQGARANANDWAITQPDGTFRLKGLAPGDYRVRAHRSGEPLRLPGKTDDDLTGVKAAVKSGTVIQVKLTVERQDGEIRGQVADEHGAAVTDAFIDAERESERAGTAPGAARRSVRGSWSRTPALTDLEGKFVIAGLAPGAYTVRASRKGGGEAFGDHVLIGQSVTLTFKATGTLSGTVALTGGGTPDQFTLRLADRASGFGRSETFFRTGGVWTMNDLPAGKLEVSADAPEGTATLEVTLGDGEQKPGVALSLARRTTLRGQVVALDGGAPVPGIRVGVTAQKGGGMSFTADPDKNNITDEGGRFQIERAPTGPILISLGPLDVRTSDYGWSQVPVDAEGGAVIDVGRLLIPKRRLGPTDRPGDLGFELQARVPGTDPAAVTLVVALVREGGPAAVAGLVVGDVIVAIDGNDVRGKQSYLYAPLARVGEGTTVSLKVERGSVVSLTATKAP